MKRTSLIGSFVASLAVLLVSACMVQNAPPPVEVHDHSKGNPPATEPPANATEPTPTPVPVATGKGADGADCQAATDCDSGICEGLGCNVPGRCMSKNRMCTMDLQPYCGCDGKTFQSSGGCPGRRYAARGECPTAAPAPAPAPPAKLADGASCASADQCSSGVCEGQGCDDKSLGKCVPQMRRCTRDHATFCSCTGQTFHGSSRCPGQRYASKGACAK
jgi:hypothetical protein